MAARLGSLGVIAEFRFNELAPRPGIEVRCSEPISTSVPTKDSEGNEETMKVGVLHRRYKRIITAELRIQRLVRGLSIGPGGKVALPTTKGELTIGDDDLRLDVKALMGAVGPRPKAGAGTQPIEACITTL